MNFSILKLSVALVLGACLTARAGLYSYTGSARDIPDGSLEGISSQITVNGASSSLTDITVHVSVSGGYNGDLYAIYSMLHDAFGTKAWQGNLYDVMKKLIETRNRIRK